MKAIILAGGYGTRLKEETSVIPKAMVKIGDKPILWHIINIFAVYNITEFIIAMGYRGNVIKDNFENLDNQDIQNNWTIELIDTGLDTMTGGRLKRLKNLVKDDEDFMVTYADGLADIDIKELLKFHKSHGKLATITAVNPRDRFGRIISNNNRVIEFNEKPIMRDSWINGGFFVLNPRVLDYIDNDQTSWECEPIKRLVNDNQLMCYKHCGFWSCMDTLSDKQFLDDLWNSGKAPWKIW